MEPIDIALKLLSYQVEPELPAPTGELRFLNPSRSACSTVSAVLGIVVSTPNAKSTISRCGR